MSGYFEYECPECGTEMIGTFGEDVTCPECGRSYETDYDNYAEDSYGGWITKEIT